MGVFDGGDTVVYIEWETGEFTTHHTCKDPEQFVREEADRIDESPVRWAFVHRRYVVTEREYSGDWDADNDQFTDDWWDKF